MRERIWNRRRRFHVGLRTIKTAAAIIVSMVIVDQYGSSASKLIFAMLGAMYVVQPLSLLPISEPTRQEAKS